MAMRVENTEESRLADAQAMGIELGWELRPTVRQKLISGELARVSMAQIPYVTTATSPASPFTMSYANLDGSGFELQVASTTTLGPTGVTSQFTCILYGATIGVRFSRLSTTPPFCVVIDGVPYEVPKYQRFPYSHNRVDTNLNDWECLHIVAENLDESIPHTVSVLVPIDPSGAKTLIFFGFVLDKKAGYREAVPKSLPYGTSTLGTALSTIPRVFGTGQPTVKSVKSVAYYNTDTTNPVTVTIVSASDTNIQKVIILPALTSGVYDFPQGGISPIPTLKHQASVAGKVLATCWGSH